MNNILKTSFIVCFVFVIAACSKKYNLSDTNRAFLVNEIDSLYQVDQEKRLVFKQLDSSYGLDIDISPRLRRIALGDDFDNYLQEADSLAQDLQESDKRNTERLIEITKDYGFPDKRRLNTEDPKAFVIFFHTPKEYFEEVHKLITAEYKAGRIGNCEFENIMWHLNERKGTAPEKDTNNEEFPCF